MEAVPSDSWNKSVTPSAGMIEVLVDGARYGDMDDVQSALQHSVDVNATDSSGRTGETLCHFDCTTAGLIARV